MKRILYVQHANGMSGSTMSLLYTMQGLDRQRFKPLVAMVYPSELVIDLYQRNGFETFYWPGLEAYQHTALGWFRSSNPIDWYRRVRQYLRMSPAVRSAARLVKTIKPDIVHLNSSVLVPIAIGAASTGVPIVWHIREPPVKGLVGYRFRWMRDLMLSLPKELIFICQYDQKEWCAGQKGVVIHNFVDFKKFDRHLNKYRMREESGLPQNAFIILYLGGANDHVKGSMVLMNALAALKKEHPKVLCLMPNCILPPSSRFSARVRRMMFFLCGFGDTARVLDSRIKRLQLSENVLRLPPVATQVSQLFATCDVLVFPARLPHYARPVIEAGAMAKPVVASRLGGITELVDHGKTGLLVEAGNSCALAEALFYILKNPSAAAQMGENAYRLARERNDIQLNAREIEAIYEKL